MRYPALSVVGPTAWLNENSSPGATFVPFSRLAASSTFQARSGIEPAYEVTATPSLSLSRAGSYTSVASGVAVGGTGVAVGGAGVAVGGMGVTVGATGVAVGGGAGAVATTWTGGGATSTTGRGCAACGGAGGGSAALGLAALGSRGSVAHAATSTAAEPVRRRRKARLERRVCVVGWCGCDITHLTVGGDVGS